MVIPVSLVPLVNAAISFHSFNLIWFGMLAVVVGVLLNWQNSRHVYWINAVVVGADDLGLLLFLSLPGHLTFAEAGLGPILFLLAFALTSVGIFHANKRKLKDVPQTTANG